MTFPLPSWVHGAMAPRLSTSVHWPWRVQPPSGMVTVTSWASPVDDGSWRRAMVKVTGSPGCTVGGDTKVASVSTGLTTVRSPGDPDGVVRGLGEGQVAS